MTENSAPLRSHFDWVAAHDATARKVQRGFHAQLQAHFQHQISADESVLELGCGAGELIAGGHSKNDTWAAIQRECAAEFANGSRLVYPMEDAAVRYKDRTYGETNISRFRHGALLFRMTWFGLWKLRCFPSSAAKRRPLP